MNHASWNSKAATLAKVKDQEVLSVLNPEKTPELTHKLLRLDEAQLDKLTGKRADIYKGAPIDQRIHSQSA